MARTIKVFSSLEKAEKAKAEFEKLSGWSAWIEARPNENYFWLGCSDNCIHGKISQCNHGCFRNLDKAISKIRRIK